MTVTTNKEMIESYDKDTEVIAECLMKAKSQLLLRPDIIKDSSFKS